MPNYDYVCGKCGEKYELNHPMSSKGKYRCTADGCEGLLAKIPSSFGIGGSGNGKSASLPEDSVKAIPAMQNIGYIDHKKKVVVNKTPLTRTFVTGAQIERAVKSGNYAFTGDGNLHFIESDK
ncbi:MAG: zinc ribbon domain-containing protein [Nanoarchaeota archaeon]